MEVDRQLMSPEDPGHGDMNYVTFTYMTFAIRRLPSPYTTHCFDYTTLGYSSRKHCLDTCLTKKSVNMSLPLPSVVKISYSSYQNSLFAIGDVDSSIETLCNKHCSKRDCEEQYLALKLISRSLNYFVMLEWYVTDAPFFITIYSPIFTLVEFVILILSCFSFWIAFCPLTIMLENQMFQSAVNPDSSEDVHVSLNLHSICNRRIARLKTALDLLFAQHVQTIDTACCFIYRPVYSCTYLRQILRLQHGLYKVVVYALCLTGCFWQIYYISEQYLHYETITHLVIMNEEVFAVPVVTACLLLTK